MKNFTEFLIAQGYELSPEQFNILASRFGTIESISLLCADGLEELGITDEKASIVICCLAQQYLRSNKYAVRKKIMNDPIHCCIQLHPLAIEVIDTPHFQRLRNIKQVGVLGYVFPSGTHSRFEHCIGTYHLAGALLEHLRSSQPELKITAKESLCVQLAGLCHDLGHGPFSHVFDGSVIPALKISSWTHEQASVMLFEDLYKRKQDVFQRWGFTDLEVTFITDLIHPKNKNYDGRSSKKPYLYDIVSNSKSGLDVDKWDYIARDCLYLGIKSRFDHLRLIPHMRVIGQDICVRDKEFKVLDDLFSTRYDLHLKAYQHPVSVGIELMLAEAMKLADGTLKFSQRIFCVDGYLGLDDSVFYTILNSSDSNLEESKRILQSIQSRRLWKFIGQTRLTQDLLGNMEDHTVKNEILQLSNWDSDCLRESLVVCIKVMHFGKKQDNPLLHIRYFKKDSVTVSHIKTNEQLKKENLHARFLDQVIFVYSKQRDVTVCAEIDIAFKAWCKNKGFPEPCRN